MIQNKFHKIILFLISIGYFTTIIHSQNNVLTANVEKDILNGLNETFKFNFEKSDKIFDRLIKSYPDAPFGYHYKSIQHLWKFLDNKNDSDLTAFFSLSDSVIEKAYNVLSGEKDDAFNYYLLGAAYAFRTMAYTRLEKYIDVVFSAKESKANLEAAIALDSTFYDAYMGTGLFNFMVAQTPPALRWAMRISGMSGDESKGLEHLKLAASEGNQSKVEAQYYLSQILIEFYGEFDQAESLLKNLIKKYPQNLLFNYSLASFYLNRTRFRETKKYANKIIASKDSSFKQLKRYSKLLLADMEFFKNNYNSAMPLYQSFLEDSSENHFRGITAYRLGLSFAFMNDSLNAGYWFAKADEGNDDIDDDRFAEMMGNRCVENYPDSVVLKMMYIKNLIFSGNYKEAYDSLKVFATTGSSNHLLPEKNLYLSKVSYLLGLFIDSYSYAISVTKNENSEKWIKSFACYYAALSSLKLKYFDDVRLYIDKIKEFSDYPYENKLANLIHALEYKFEKVLNHADKH